jgi:hypothetical protein
VERTGRLVETETQNQLIHVNGTIETYRKGKAISRKKQKKMMNQKIQEHMHPIQFLLAATQLELLIFPLEQRLRQMN